MAGIVFSAPSWGQQISIIPVPVVLKPGIGQFHLTTETIISVPANQVEMARIADYLVAKLKPATGYAMPIAYQAEGNIQLGIDPKYNLAIGNEGYTLNVTDKGVLILGNTPAGVFYGVQSLLQLLPAQIECHQVIKGIDWIIPAVAIQDFPRFAWRGLMLDVSRHFFSKEYVKSYIDQMARYKFNRFHWHLTDDEGWRIQIKSYPRLTSVGAWRVPRDGAYGNAHPPEPGEEATYGGFYTQEDIKEVVQFAKDRFIEVLPEVDIPGHSMAALAAYPELSVTKNPDIKVNPGSNFATWFGNGKFEMHIDNTLNPTDENVYVFLDKVFTEISRLFPFEYIHIGGDECYKGYWERDPGVQTFMKKNKIRDDADLQAYFNKKVSAIIVSKKKKLMGWDEILEGGAPASAAVMSWHGVSSGEEATKLKHSVVMSPAPLYYLDMMQGDPAVEARVYGKARLRDVYEFEILSSGMDSSYVLGGQANLWTEQITNPGKAEYMTYPRALAVSETLWSRKGAKQWSGFVARVEGQFKRLDQAGVNYSASMFDPVISIRMESGKLLLDLNNEVDGLDTHYTLDNSIPDKFSAIYTHPITLSQEVVNLRLITFRGEKPVGRLISLTRAEMEKRTGSKK